MRKVINVLIFEEDDANFQLFKHQCLTWAPNCIITRADSRKKLEIRLKWMNYNLILVGFGQPSFTDIDLLFYIKDLHTHSPLVFLLDASQEYSVADTAVMKHGAAALYQTEFQQKCFLLEEVLQKSMPTFNLQLAADRKILEGAIRRGRARKPDGVKMSGTAHIMENVPQPSEVPSGRPTRSFPMEATIRSAGSQDSDTPGTLGQDPEHQSSSIGR